MKKAIERDLADLVVILEDLTDSIDDMPQADLIDMAARLKPVAKACKVIDEFTKEFVKKKLKGKGGSVPGALFKANLTIVPVERFQQKLFKESEPETYAEYTKTDQDQRVTFEVR